MPDYELGYGQADLDVGGRYITKLPLVAMAGVIAAGGKPTFDVSAYGGDPSLSDNTTAIVKAINAIPATGGNLYFGPGIWSYATAIELKSGIQVSGAGQGVTILRPIGGIAGIHGSGLTDLTFYNFTIDGSQQTTGTLNCGIYLQTCSRIYVVGIEIKTTWADGFMGVLCTDGLVTNCNVHNCGDNNAPAAGAGANGIRFQGGSRFQINNNRIRDITRQYSHGIVAECGTGAPITDVVIDSNLLVNMGSGSLGGGGAIAVTSSQTIAGTRGTRATITGNVCHTSADSTIWLNADYSSVVGNILDDNKNQAIEIQDCHSFTCNDNTCSNMGSHGIMLHQGPGGGSGDLIGLLHGTVCNNVVDTVTGAARAGISVQGDGVTLMRDLSICNNIIRNCFTPGIVLAAMNGDTVISGNSVLDNDVSAGGFGGIRIYGNASPLDCSGTIITSNRVGDTRVGGARTQEKGLQINNLAANLLIANNDLRNNTVSAIENTSSGTGIKIFQNAGYNPLGVVAITVTASPFTYTAGSTPEMVSISGGTVSLIVKNGITLFTATNASVLLQPGEAVVVTYTVAPTMNADRK